MEHVLYVEKISMVNSQITVETMGQWICQMLAQVHHEGVCSLCILGLREGQSNTDPTRWRQRLVSCSIF